MLPIDIEEWLNANQHPAYEKHVLGHKDETMEILNSLGVDPNSELAFVYANYGSFPIKGWYELNEAHNIDEWSSYAHNELGVPSNYLALTSIEGQGITLYDKTSGQVYDVEFGQFDSLRDGMLKPIANSFLEFLRWCKCKQSENA